VVALGQRTWTTDQGDWGMLQIGGCRFTGESDDAAS
ncbi:ImpE protein superfamily protein, partial [Burkholderia pseudomallei]|nr:ImpE protein superfamily protein [Burkholderia pseudomallei]MBF3602524.1 ImpE protein superfamily protein [Burkholderia pseudomallei]